MGKKEPFSNLDHIAVVVKDIDKAIERLQSLGMGPFDSPQEKQGAVATDKATRPKYRVSFGKMGPIRVQLIQPVEGQSRLKKFLETTGGGIHHVGFTVEDIDRDTALLEEKGLKVDHRVAYEKGGGATVFQAEDNGLVIELVQWSA